MAADRYQIAAAADSVLARDRIVNTLYFEDIGTSDHDGNCLALANIFQTDWYQGGAREIVVKCYDVGSPPNFPKGEATINLGQAPASNAPREVALCLSFYSERNLPRQRGRIYLPVVGSGFGLDVRPTAANRTRVMTLANSLAAMGGADVSWNVHSTVTGEDHQVTHAWCDDEWDTMRSRGLRPTTRTLVETGS